MVALNVTGRPDAAPAGAWAGAAVEAKGSAMALAKSSLRRVLLSRRAGLTAQEILVAAVAVEGRLLSLPEVAAAPAVALYVGFAGELDLGLVFKELKGQGKGTVLPRFNAAAGGYELVPVDDLSADTVVGHYGIREPAAGRPALGTEDRQSARLLWLVPGVAFDAAGNRLGRGRGYYDRLLAGCRGCRIGIAYDWQLVESVPADAHDVRMDVVVTDRRLVRCPPGRAGVASQPVDGAA